MATRRRRFEARIRKQGPNFHVEVPPAVSRAFARFAERGKIRVHGTLGGVEVRGTLVPRGRRHWLFLHAGMRAAAGVGAGDTITLALRATPWERVPIAADIERALRQAEALADFESRSPSHRHELLRWVEIAESPERRAQRLAAMVDDLKGVAKPVNKGRAAGRHKPLWICPECGHRFVNLNQWHSCKRYSLDEVFAGCGPGIRPLFDHLRTMVESVGPVHLQAYRDRVAFLVRVRFLAAIPRRNWLDVGFWLPRRVECRRFHKIETLTPTDHVHLLRLTAKEQLDARVQGWIREGYRVGEQQHLS